MTTPPLQPVVTWLLQDWALFGLHGQNWMPALAVALVAYAAGALLAERIGAAMRSH